MAFIYARGNMIWMGFRNADGRRTQRSTGYRLGQERLARKFAADAERKMVARRATVEREPSTAVARNPARIGGSSLTVRQYAEQWLKRRTGFVTRKDEAARLRRHAYPLIGDMLLADVRPRHIRDMVAALREKTSTANKCKGQKLAPRTVRHVFGSVRLLFKGAVIDEQIAASPVIVEKGVLPRSVDKDPAWRPTAIFERSELVTLISDPRIARHRRVLHALKGLAGLRQGEAAGLRWSDYDSKCKPLGKLIVSRSGEKVGTKTQVTREIPVHSVLALILAEWQRAGWADTFGRKPTTDDLILPTRKFKVRKAADTMQQFKKDLALVGLRQRRGHDLRRTFITLVQADGGRREVLKPLTHPGERDIVGLYTTFPWATVCAEIAKLHIPMPHASKDDGATLPPQQVEGKVGSAEQAATTPTRLEDVIRAIVRDVVREELRISLAERALWSTPSEGEEGYLSLENAARHADVATGTLRRWIRTGRLPARRAGRVYRIARSEIENFLCACGKRLSKVAGDGVPASSAVHQR